MRIVKKKKALVLLAAVVLTIKVVNFADKSSASVPLDDGNDLVREKSNEDIIEEMFMVRKRRLKEVCLEEGRTPPATVADSQFPRKTVIDAAHNIVYCAVQKTASTFLTNTLIAINSRGKYNSPFQIKETNFLKLDSLVEKYEDFQKSRSESFRKAFMRKAKSMLVVRDPYTRLFSAYTDKIYHPNHYFWRTTGRIIEKMARGDTTPGCGNTVSFRDFIKYIIREYNQSSIDPHFTPIYMHCDPCTAKYDYIMSFENLKDEFFYMMNIWNISYNLNVTISFNDFEKETAIKIAEEHISMTLLTLKRYSLRCNIPPYNFLLRTWRFLQISGVLPKSAAIPFPNNQQADRITKRTYLDVVKNVLSQNIDLVKLKQQRYEALVQAYREIDKADVNTLINIMKPDCQYFGYDDTPNYLFEDSTNAGFNFFDGL